MLALLLCALGAAGGCGGEVRSRGPFDGEAALAYARVFMEFGPRVPGSEAHRRAGDWIAAEMRKRADTVIEQRWVHVTRGGDSLPLRNVLARFRPQVRERVLYVAHWDSRPRAENARDPAQRSLPTPGANDGASSVGLLIALADLLRSQPVPYGVDLLFVDGEDYGEFGPPEVDVLLGSTYFAANPPEPDYAPLFGVVWDMIGDADLQIDQEEHSVREAPEVVARVWDAAARLGYSSYFRPQVWGPITDDHLPFLRRGWRVIDVIDITYPYHHTVEDTVDKISARSLKIVGDVAWEVLQ
ncbi:MAG TPA: M28 family peptidase [Gemmatimonadaceae bacterium]|nr:M28 family peptidase [Gemmatimonadaceae bacterium]